MKRPVPSKDDILALMRTHHDSLRCGCDWCHLAKLALVQGEAIDAAVNVLVLANNMDRLDLSRRPYREAYQKLQRCRPENNPTEGGETDGP